MYMYIVPGIQQNILNLSAIAEFSYFFLFSQTLQQNAFFNEFSGFHVLFTKFLITPVIDQ
jgi:hypothetical protein